MIFRGRFFVLGGERGTAPTIAYRALTDNPQLVNTLDLRDILRDVGAVPLP